MRFVPLVSILCLAAPAFAQEHHEGGANAPETKWELFATPWGSADFVPKPGETELRLGLDVGFTHNWEWGRHAVCLGPGLSVNSRKEFGPLVVIDYLYGFGPGERWFFGPELLGFADFTTHGWVATGGMLGPVLGVRVSQEVSIALGLSAMLSIARIEPAEAEGLEPASATVGMVPGGLLHFSVAVGIPRRRQTKTPPVASSGH
jgi:hypothetical protein